MNKATEIRLPKIFSIHVCSMEIIVNACTRLSVAVTVAASAKCLKRVVEESVMSIASLAHLLVSACFLTLALVGRIVLSLVYSGRLL